MEEITGLERSTIQTYKSVSNSVDSLLRNKDLSFNHHKEVAALPELKQAEFLQKASEQKLSVRELRQEIRNERNGEKVIEPLPTGIFNIIYCDLGKAWWEVQ